MRSVLVDLHKMEGMIQVSGLQRGHDATEDAYYAAVLKEHGVTQAQFDSSIVWYTKHPQLFDKIYPKVFAQISAEREEFERWHQDILGPETDEVETPILLSDQEVQYRLDSLYWVFQHGMPAYGWIEGWQRPLPTPPYK